MSQRMGEMLFRHTLRGVLFYFMGVIMYKKQYATIIAACLLTICICVIIILNVFNGSDGNYSTYQIDIEANCIYNDSVGNEWTKIFIMDGKEISNGHRITIQNNKESTKTINVIITEYDKHADVGMDEIIIPIRDAATSKKTIYVCEKEGMQNGKIAEWEIIVHIKLVQKMTV